MSCSLTLYVGNSNVIELQALTNSVTDSLDTAATVEVTLKDTAGNNVSGQSWPATMVHDTGGTYRATLEGDIAITAGEHYIAVIDVTGSGVETAQWTVRAVADIRAS